jgi:hypothetical protein
MTHLRQLGVLALVALLLNLGRGTAAAEASSGPPGATRRVALQRGFGPQVLTAAGPAPFMIALGDVNGDRQPDLLVANYSGHITDTARDGLTWVRNDGGRRFGCDGDRAGSADGVHCLPLVLKPII